MSDGGSCGRDCGTIARLFGFLGVRLRYADARRLAQTALALLPRGEIPGALEVACEVGGRRLNGRLASVMRSGTLQLRCASLKAKDYLRAWVGHLVLHLARPELPNTRSFLIGVDKRLVLTPVADPAAALSRLLDLYRRGMTHPIHLFPESAIEYCSRLQNGATRDIAFTAALGKWEGHDGNGESEDPYNRLWHGMSRPLDDDFRATATEVFGPLLAHCESV